MVVVAPDENGLVSLKNFEKVFDQYANRSKKQITIRIDEDTIDYFKEMAETKGIQYQSLINLYLRDSAAENKELKTKWE